MIPDTDCNPSADDHQILNFQLSVLLLVGCSNHLPSRGETPKEARTQPSKQPSGASPHLNKGPHSWNSYTSLEHLASGIQHFDTILPLYCVSTSAYVPYLTSLAVFAIPVAITQSIDSWKALGCCLSQSPYRLILFRDQPFDRQDRIGPEQTHTVPLSESA